MLYFIISIFFMRGLFYLPLKEFPLPFSILQLGKCFENSCEVPGQFYCCESICKIYLFVLFINLLLLNTQAFKYVSI